MRDEDALNWISVTRQIDGCRFICIRRANLIEDSHYVCGDEDWWYWQNHVLNDMFSLGGGGELVFGSSTHVPRSNETFYLGAATLYAQLEPCNEI